MAISLVSGAIDQNDGFAQSWSVTFSNISPSSGNLLVAVFSIKRISADPEFETPSGWTLVQKHDNSTDSCQSAMFYKISDGTETSVGADIDTGSTLSFAYNAVVLEFTGNAASSVLDASNIDSSEANSGDKTSATGSATPTADGYAVAAFAWHDSRIANEGTHSLSSSFSLLHDSDPVNSVTYPINVIGGLAYTGTAAKSCIDTTTDTGGKNVGIIGLFKEAGGGGGDPDPFFQNQMHPIKDGLRPLSAAGLNGVIVT